MSNDQDTALGDLAAGGGGHLDKRPAVSPSLLTAVELGAALRDHAAAMATSDAATLGRLAELLRAAGVGLAAIPQAAPVGAGLIAVGAALGKAVRAEGR